MDLMGFPRSIFIWLIPTLSFNGGGVWWINSIINFSIIFKITHLPEQVSGVFIGYQLVSLERVRVELNGVLAFVDYFPAFVYYIVADLWIKRHHSWVYLLLRSRKSVRKELKSHKNLWFLKNYSVRFLNHSWVV